MHNSAVWLEYFYIFRVSWSCLRQGLLHLLGRLEQITQPGGLRQ